MAPATKNGLGKSIAMLCHRLIDICSAITLLKINLMAVHAICEDLYSLTLELPLDSDRDLLITGHVLHMLSKLATFGNTQKSSY